VSYSQAATRVPHQNESQPETLNYKWNEHFLGRGVWALTNGKPLDAIEEASLSFL